MGSLVKKTTNLGLNLVGYGVREWHDYLNDNFEILDTVVQEAINKGYSIIVSSDEPLAPRYGQIWIDTTNGSYIEGVIKGKYKVFNGEKFEEFKFITDANLVQIADVESVFGKENVEDALKEIVRRMGDADDLAGEGRTDETIKGNADKITEVEEDLSSHLEESATLMTLGHVKAETTEDGTIILNKQKVGLGNVDNVKQIPATDKGTPGGVVPLGSDGKIDPMYTSGATSIKLAAKDGNFVVYASTGQPTTMVIDSMGDYAYIFSTESSNKYYIYKYSLATGEQVARSDQVFFANSTGVVQDNLYLYIPVGIGSATSKGSLAKINKETMITEKLQSIGNFGTGDCAIHGDLIYISSYGGRIKAYTTADLTEVKTGTPFSGSGINSTKMAISPNGRMFGFMVLYDEKEIKEIDIETITTIATSPVSQGLRWLHSSDDNYVFFGVEDQAVSSIGRLNIGGGQFTQEPRGRLSPIGKGAWTTIAYWEDYHVYVTRQGNPRDLTKVSKDKLVPVYTVDMATLGGDISKGGLGDDKLYYITNSIIYRTAF